MSIGKLRAMGFKTAFKSAAQLYVLVASLLFTSLAGAVGLGELQTSSHLGQPFSATIGILGDVGDINSDNLLVRSVQAAEAEALGLEILPLPTRMSFDLRASGNGYVIDIKSAEPVAEPFFNVFLELRWPSGVIYKEYSVLLDPPEIALSRSAAAQAPAQSISTPSPPNTARPASGSGSGSFSARVIDVSASQEYKVQAGDSLSDIAGRVSRGSGLSRADAASWILENNQRAFVRGNPDLLKAGAVLRLPEYSEDFAKTAAVSENTAEIQEENIAVASSSQVATRAPQSAEVRGLLTVSSLSSEDRAQELMDMLSRENDSLREKITNLEESEYVQTMKDLVETQRDQIRALQNRLGVDGSAYLERTAPMLAQLEGEIKVQATTVAAREADKDGTGQFDNPEAATNGVVKLDVLVPEALRAPSKKRNYFFFWLTVAAVVLFTFLFLGMYIYYRRLVKAKAALTVDQYGKFKATRPSSQRTAGAASTTMPYGSTAYASGSSTRTSEKDKPIDIDIAASKTVPQSPQPSKPKLTEVGQQNADWFGEQLDIKERRAKNYEDTVNEIQKEFASLSPKSGSLEDEAVLSDTVSGKVVSDVIEGLTSPLPGDVTDQDLAVDYKFDESNLNNDKKPIDTKDTKVSSIFGRKKKDEPALPSEDELKTSIAEKMSNYNPSGAQHQSNAYGLDAFGLDEIMGEDDMIGDEVDSLIYRARLYCDYRKYKQAYKLIDDAIEDGEDDERLVNELDRINQFLRVEEQPSA